MTEGTGNIEDSVVPKKEKKPKKKRPREFAGIIWNMFKPLNDSEYFKEKYGGDSYRFLLEATDQRYAALMVVKDGTINVEGIKKEKGQKTVYKTLDPKPDAAIRCSLETLLGVAGGKVSKGGMLKLLLTRKLVIKNPRLLMSRLLKYFKVISYLQKNKQESG